MESKDGAGLGLFGAEYEDTFSFKISPDLIQRDNLVDGQN
jgi:hypothetical protein